MKHFVYGSWWVSIGAAALTWLSWSEMGGTGIPLVMVCFVLGATLIIYNLNMLSGLKDLRKRGTASVRHIWCLDHEEAMKAYLGAGILLAGVAFFLLRPTAWLLMTPAAVAALLYVFPVVRGIKLREFGLYKIFLIATVWAVVTVGLPATQSDTFPPIHEVMWLFAERWLFIFAITVPFDVRDLTTDAQKGVRTLPSVFGWKKSLTAAVAALLGFTMLAFMRMGVMEMIGYAPAILMALGLILATRPHRNDMYYSFWMEGTMVVLAVGSLTLSHLG